MSYKNSKYLPNKKQNPALKELEEKLRIKKQKEKALIELKEAEVYQHYANFQLFMNWKNPPHFVIDPILVNKYHAETQMPVNAGDPFILELSPTVIRMQRDSYAAVLYHEFTHIFDDSTIHKEVTDMGIQKPTTWYTEAHATEIELMFLCGFQNVSEHKRIPFDTVIRFCGNEMYLEEFGKQKKKEYLNHLSYAKQWISNGTNRNATEEYAAAIKRLQYYFGFLRFCKLHCDIDADTWSRLIKTDFLVAELGANILKIKKVALQRYICVDDFTNLQEFDRDMFRDWMKRNI